MVSLFRVTDASRNS